MDNKILLVANWKANVVDLKLWLNSLRVSELESQKVEVAIATPYPTLSLLSNLTTHQLTLASQDVSAFSPGAYTGEVPAQLLSNLGVKYSLI